MVEERVWEWGEPGVRGRHVGEEEL